jgi:2'-5' RNA ligase
VSPPAENLEQVSQLVRALKRPLASLGLQVAWTSRESYHLTLKFLGNVEEDRLGAMVAQLQSQLLAQPLGAAPQVELAGLGVFPGPQRPHVLFVEGRGEGGLATLAERLESWLAPLGYAAEERPFHPHVTIGRVRGGGDAERQSELEELLQRHATDRHGAPFAVEELILYESRSSPTGPKYTPLARLPLVPPPARATT